MPKKVEAWEDAGGQLHNSVESALQMEAYKELLASIKDLFSLGNVTPDMIIDHVWDKKIEYTNYLRATHQWNSKIIGLLP